MASLINMELMREPWNWVTITLMCLFGLLLLQLLVPDAGSSQ